MLNINRYNDVEIQQKLNFPSKSITNKSSDPSFTGLSTVMEKTVYTSPELFQKIMGVFFREDGRVGSLPLEIVKIIKENAINRSEITQQIASVQSGFSNAAKILRDMELETSRKMKAINVEEYINKIFDEALKLMAGAQNPEELINFNNKMGKEFLPSQEFIENLQVQSANILEKVMKKNSIIPPNGSIRVTYLGQGAFGNAYQISFLDETGKKLFNDKVLKVYKDPNINADANEILSKEFINYYKNMTKEQYVEKFGAIIEKIPFIPESQKSMTRSILEESYEQIKNMSDEEIKDLANMFLGGNEAWHGVIAEANAATFVKSAIGHKLAKSDLIQPYYFNLKDHIGLTEMSDETLGAVTKKTDFTKLGLIHSDINMNPNNTVAGRTIDYGGIQVGNKALAQNKVARRYYKRISGINRNSPIQTIQDRIDTWNRYYNLAINNKIPQSQDVLIGLEEAKKLIDKSYWNKLQGFYEEENWLSDLNHLSEHSIFGKMKKKKLL